MALSHGFVDGRTVKQPPLLSTIGLTAIGRDYHFQGTMKQIKSYMDGGGANIGLRVSHNADYPNHNWNYLVVDVYDVAISAAAAYQKAVVAAIPGVNILGAIIGAAKGKKVIMKLRYGFTAPPESSSHVRVHIELPDGANLSDLAEALDGNRKVSALKLVNIGVGIAKTVVKILA